MSDSEMNRTSHSSSEVHDPVVWTNSDIGIWIQQIQLSDKWQYRILWEHSMGRAQSSSEPSGKVPWRGWGWNCPIFVMLLAISYLFSNWEGPLIIVVIYSVIKFVLWLLFFHTPVWLFHECCDMGVPIPSKDRYHNAKSTRNVLLRI
jgi:hypothetical protein